MISASPSPATVPPPIGGDLAAWRAAIAALPIDFQEKLAPMLQRARLRAARLAQRDELLLRLVVGKQGSITELADQAHSDLLRYNTTGWRADEGQSAPREARNHLLHQILTISGGDVPAANSLRKIYGGKKLIKFSGGNDQRSGGC